MSYADNPYRAPLGDFAAMAAADERANFITKTYLHLAGAIDAVRRAGGRAVEHAGHREPGRLMIGGRFSWLIVLGAFMRVSYVADSWANSAVSPGMQYAGPGAVRGGRGR